MAVFCAVRVRRPFDRIFCAYCCTGFGRLQWSPSRQVSSYLCEVGLPARSKFMTSSTGSSLRESPKHYARLAMSRWRAAEHMISSSDLAFTGQRSTATVRVLLRSTRPRPLPVARVDRSRWRLACLPSRSKASRRPSTRCEKGSDRCAWSTWSRKSRQRAGCSACPVLLAQPSTDA